MENWKVKEFQSGTILSLQVEKSHNYSYEVYTCEEFLKQSRPKLTEIVISKRFKITIEK